MSKVSNQSMYYEIQEKMGEGATCEVYSAFRTDSEGWMRQPVALKIIKSQKNVQILKMEFEKLLRVRSQHCVQVYGWENFPQGTALVLERIHGVTLDQILKAPSLKWYHKAEIFRQIQKGLVDLHQHSVLHGDLNLSNILVDHEGLVKLIDFGFFSDKESWVTPYFASPNILAGEGPSKENDLYALGQIEKYMFSLKGRSLRRIQCLAYKMLTPFDRGKNFERAHNFNQKSLAGIVHLLLKKSEFITQVIGVKKPSIEKIETRGRFFLRFLTFAFFLVLALWPETKTEKNQFATLKITGGEWFELSLNHLPPQYAPLEKRKIRLGRYNLFWKSAQSSGHKTLLLKKPETFWLKASGKTLR